jgi:uncharacterized membrane protein
MSFLGSNVGFSKDPVWPWSVYPIGLPALLLVAVALVVLTVWTYHGVRGARGRRVMCVLALRLAALALTCLILLRPSLTSQDAEQPPSLLLMLLDGSESMTIRDEYDNQSRWELLCRLFHDCEPLLRELEDQHHVTVQAYRFAEDAGEFDPTGKADGKRTDFGQALRTLYERHGHERNLRGLVVVSDGADNGTRYPTLAEGARWRGLACPIQTFGLGKATTAERQRDIGFTAIAPEPPSVPVKGKLVVKAVLDAPGFANTEVTVKMLVDGQEVRAQRETLRKATGNEIRLTADAPEKAGEVKVTLKFDAPPGDAVDTNNEISTFVTVTHEGVSVLLVDKPRFPEPQLICDALAADPRIRLYTAWLRGDQPAGDRADLFGFDKQHYDVAILGDVSVRRLGGPDVARKIQEIVGRKGAGLLMMGGYETFGNSDWRGTALEELLPVQLDAGGQADELWHLSPTAAGLSHYIMRLADNPDASRALWVKLPRLDGLTRLGQEKAGATVLAVREDNQQPVLVSQDYGSGRTLAFAGDTTWRWQRLGQPRSREGIDAHARFWKQVVFWLAKRDLAEGNVWVKPDGRRIPVGGKLGFSAGLRGKGGIDAPEASFEARVVTPQGAEVPVPVSREQEGDRGTFWKTDSAGEYRLIVRGRGKDTDGNPLGPEETSARFLVYEDDAELVRRAADHEFLTRLAATAGGQFHKAEDLPAYLRALPFQPLPQVKPKAQLWPDWRSGTMSAFHVAVLLAFCGLLCLEWLIRRLWGMV